MEFRKMRRIKQRLTGKECIKILKYVKTGHKQDAIKQCNKVSFCVIEKDDVIKDFHAAEILRLKYNEDKETIGKEIKREWRVLNNLTSLFLTIS